MSIFINDGERVSVCFVVLQIISEMKGTEKSLLS